MLFAYVWGPHLWWDAHPVWGACPGWDVHPVWGTYPVWGAHPMWGAHPVRGAHPVWGGYPVWAHIMCGVHRGQMIISGFILRSASVSLETGLLSLTWGSPFRLSVGEHPGVSCLDLLGTGLEACIATSDFLCESED